MSVLYHKIHGIYKRHTEGPQKGKFVEGEFAKPEFEYLFDASWQMTEKVDGTNIRIVWDYDKRTVQFGGRTERANLPADLLDHLQSVYTPERFDDLTNSMVLFGEGYGAGIQKGGGNYGKDKRFVLFDIKCGDYWLQRSDIEGIAHAYSIDVVPIIHTNMSLRDGIELVRQGIQSTWGEFEAEGFVCIPHTQLFNRYGERVITKLKCCDFK